jgi:F0F1-type ATP synthase gamma subunit
VRFTQKKTAISYHIVLIGSKLRNFIRKIGANISNYNFDLRKKETLLMVDVLKIETLGKVRRAVSRFEWLVDLNG